MTQQGLQQNALIDSQDEIRRKKVVRRTSILVGLILIGMAIGAGRTVMSRMTSAKTLESGTAELAALYVQTTKPKITESGQTLALPGTLQGFVQSPIAARSSGYLRRWHKDIGSRVQKGELLAEIETPEIDQQLSQAVAARDQAASSLALAKSTVERWEALRQRDAVSQQELDERRSLFTQQRANLAAADANVERLRQLEGFKRIVAPFAGVITKRNVDVGDLIEPGGGNAGRALFILAQTDPLRMYINVPQSYAHMVKAGQEVSISQVELQGQKFSGIVARVAGAIDPATRTMQVEVTLPNRGGELMPGAFVKVALPLKSTQTLGVPTNTLMIRAEGIRVATIGADSKVHLVPVQLGRNLGPVTEILEGVSTTDQLIINPPDSLTEGDVVRVAAPAAPKASAKTVEKAAQ